MSLFLTKSKWKMDVIRFAQFRLFLAHHGLLKNAKKKISRIAKTVQAQIYPLSGFKLQMFKRRSRQLATQKAGHLVDSTWSSTTREATQIPI